MGIAGATGTAATAGRWRAMVAADGNTAVRGRLGDPRRSAAIRGDAAALRFGRRTRAGREGGGERDEPPSAGGMKSETEEMTPTGAAWLVGVRVASCRWRSARFPVGPGGDHVIVKARAGTASASARAESIKEPLPSGRPWPSRVDPSCRGRWPACRGSSLTSRRPGWQRPGERDAAAMSGHRTVGASCESFRRERAVRGRFAGAWCR